MTRLWTCLSGVALLIAACGSPLDLGSDVAWSTTHEGGDLSDWRVDGMGDALTSSSDQRVHVTGERAHDGSFSAKLTKGWREPTRGAVCLWRTSSAPAAYYSAWLYIADQYRTATTWTIWQFQSGDDVARSNESDDLDLRLRSLPGGGYVLYVFDHDARFLQSPIPAPAPIVQPGRWVHLSVYYRPVVEEVGRFSVWLDGEQVYDFERQPVVAGPVIRWSVCNAYADLRDSSNQQVPGVLFVDDAAVSQSRVVPEWRFTD